MFERVGRDAIVESIERGQRFVNDALTIRASCIAEIRCNILLIAEIESKVPGKKVKSAVVILITREQAERLIRAGVRVCPVVRDISRLVLGTNAELLGAFIVGNKVINIFERASKDIRDNRKKRGHGSDCNRSGCDRLILVGTHLVPVIRS